ncbi:MAG TPA: N-acetyl-gamma-glutamyl-phosphate reductase [Thermosynergistes sp.]|nr:N-acetyl-gamma-glutamyl-phosphate reductase [Thermosynergistes sp.]
MPRVAVWGGAGMTGGELLRLLARHPSLELAVTVSRSQAGKPIWHQHPVLRPDYPDMTFSNPEDALKEEVDLAFLALPHGASCPIIREYRKKGVPVVDLSADVRLRDEGIYKRWYGRAHPSPELLKEAVYGLPELHREELKGATLASGVGCNATCAILGLFPLAREGQIEHLHLEVRVGSSEGGANPTQGSHHPYRSRAMRVIDPFRHRHLAEILQELKLPEESVAMTTTAVEMVRGVQMMAYVTLKDRVSEAELWKLYRKAFRNEPFLHLCPAQPAHLRFPDPRYVLGSNRALIGFALHDDGRRLLVASAIDNLMKGASGTALQAANVMLGLPEETGLTMMPVFPA